MEIPRGTGDKFKSKIWKVPKNMLEMHKYCCPIEKRMSENTVMQCFKENHNHCDNWINGNDDKY